MSLAASLPNSPATDRPVEPRLRAAHAAHAGEKVALAKFLLPQDSAPLSDSPFASPVISRGNETQSCYSVPARHPAGWTDRLWGLDGSPIWDRELCPWSLLRLRASGEHASGHSTLCLRLSSSR
jgi:hypothetical protein